MMSDKAKLSEMRMELLQLKEESTSQEEVSSQILELLHQYESVFSERAKKHISILKQQDPNELPRELRIFVKRFKAELGASSDELQTMLSVGPSDTSQAELNIDEKIRGMPKEFAISDQSPLSDNNESWNSESFISESTEKLIALGNEIAEQFKSRLTNTHGSQSSDVRILFDQYVDPPLPIEKLLSELKDQGFEEQVSQDDLAWDEEMATAMNTFETAIVEHLSQAQKASSNWDLAVRKYRSESRNAWRTFNVRLSGPSDHNSKTKRCNDVYQEVKYFKRSSEVGNELQVYQQARSQAISDLATAFGELVKEQYTGGADATVGEATLIHAEQVASEKFWSSVQTALENPSTKAGYTQLP